jgi:hypothetical protein
MESVLVPDFLSFTLSFTRFGRTSGVRIPAFGSKAAAAMATSAASFSLVRDRRASPIRASARIRAKTSYIGKSGLHFR